MLASPMRAIVSATVVLISAVGCAERDPSAVTKQIRARLSEQLAAKVAVRSLVEGGRGGAVCGYAEEVDGVGFAQPIPFVFQNGTLTLHRDGVDAFNRAQRDCGPGWVGPRDQPGMS